MTRTTDRLTHADLRTLAAHEHSPSVSIYLPTYRAGREVAQGPIRLKNLIREAELKLEKEGFSGWSRDGLRPAADLADDAFFWRQQLNGLALFASEGQFHAFRLSTSLPETASVSCRYYLIPLLDYLAREPSFFVLTLAAKQVRLLEGSPYGLIEVQCPGLPSAMSDVVAENEPESQLQHHSVARQGAIFHGHGGDESGSAERELQFLGACNRAVTNYLRGTKTPLFLSCVDLHFAPYKRLNTYDQFLDVPLSGSPGSLSEQEILEHCSAILARRFEEGIKDAAENYRTNKASGASSEKLVDVVKAAVEGRVDTVWIPRGRQLVGAWQPDRHDIQLRGAGGCTYDLLDFAGVQTYLTGGRVFVVPPDSMPDHGPVAATFRY